ncbi:kinase-like domain, phloem protein 2-like protein [Tanacetum coccineum]|uniref:Kinase-like domain, phloem protein 2-like protein n=1 Tax=Tanacetum coccineum TaxID=301880 RepID=A0ABQ5BF26_9ASTR
MEATSTISRFGEVAVITCSFFDIQKKIKFDVVSPETTYAIYLIYKLPQHQSKFPGLLQISRYPEYRYIYLVSPPETPIIGQKLDENTHKYNPLNRPIQDYSPRQRRSDGWMDVKVWQFQTRSSPSTETINIDIWLRTPDGADIDRLIIESIELRPIVGHSV